MRAATVDGDGAAELVPFPSIHETVMAVQGGAVDRALVPIENSLEGGVNATLDALALEAREVAIVGETVLAIRNCLIARDAIALDEIERRRLPPAAARAVRAVPARGAAGRRRSARRRRPPTPCARSPPRTRRGRRSARAPPPSSTAAAVLRDGIDDEPDNATRFVWLARTGTPPARDAGERRLEDVGGVRGRGRPRRRAGSCAACRSSPSAASTSRRSSRGRAQGRLGPLPLPRRHGRPRRGPARRRRGRRARRRTARRCGCSGAIPRRDAGFAGWSAPRTATLPAQERRHGESHTTRPRVVRAGFRAPAART